MHDITPWTPPYPDGYSPNNDELCTSNPCQPWLSELVKGLGYYKVKLIQESPTRLRIMFIPNSSAVGPAEDAILDTEIPTMATDDRLGTVKASPADIYDTDFVHIDRSGHLRFNPSGEAPVYYTPEMFGAVGDGSSDDTKAFRDALNAANLACRPLVACGFYKLSSTISITRDKSAIYIPGEIHYTDPDSYAFDVHCKYSELHINRMFSDGMGIKFVRRKADDVEVDRNTCFLNNIYCTGTCVLMHAETLGVQYNDIYIGASIISYSGDCVVLTADKPGRAWIGEPRFIGGQIRSDNGYAIKTGGEVNGPRFIGVSIEDSPKGIYLSACSNGSFRDMRRENATAIKFVGVNSNNHFSGHTTFAADVNLKEAKPGQGTDPIATFDEPLALGSFYAGEYATCADSSVITYRKRWAFKPRFRIQTVSDTGSAETPVVIGPLANKAFPSHVYTPANSYIKLGDMFDIGGVSELYVSTNGACSVYAPDGKLIAKLTGPYGRYKIFAFNESYWIAQKLA